MKSRLLYLLVLGISVISLTSCYDDDNKFDVTSAKDMAGEWQCAVRYGGEVHHATFRTSNTSADVEGVLLLTDGGTFWSAAVDVNCDYSARSFETPASGNKNKYIKSGKIGDFTVIVKNGKITLSVIELPSKTTRADKIEFTIMFSDDDENEEIKVVGYRKTGFLEDNDFYYEEGL